MAKRKQAPANNPPRGRQVDPIADQRQQGLRAFQAGRFDSAISIWSGLAQRDPQVKVALAEAYFRRALRPTSAQTQLADLQQATALCPEELRYQYHLGLTFHRARELPAAIQQYQALLQRDPTWPGAAMVLALATLEQHPQADLASLPGLTPAVQATLAPVQALLRGEVPPRNDARPMDQFWHGLGLICQNNPAAQEVLADHRPLPSTQATTIRSYYQGVAAAQAGEMTSAMRKWQQAHAGGMRQNWLFDNLATVWIEQLSQQLEANDLNGALQTAQEALKIPLNNSVLNQMLVQTLDQGAHTAAAAGDWAQATQLWEGARQTIGISSGLGTPRPILHNLALAYEMQEHWTEAAETWRAMLRTRPRKKAKPEDAGLSDEQWEWIRKRVIEAYKRAGRPDEAITVFRQAIKADPDDLGLRLQLVDAFIMNDQEQSAMNELQRIVQINPDHIEAQLRLATIYTQRGEWYVAESSLQQVIAQNPTREDIRRQVAHLFLIRAGQQHEYMRYAEAIKSLETGWPFAPNEYRFPLNLARIAFDQHQPDKARSYLERTLELAGDQPDAYMQVIDCWVIEDQISEARAVLARAEATVSPPPEFYLSLGITIVMRTAPEPAQFSPFAAAPPPPPPPQDTPWTQMATELLNRAITLNPTEPRIPGMIANELMTLRPDLALHYAGESVRIAPDDPNALMILGIAQALNAQKREAKQTLRTASRQASRQGLTAMAQDIENLRKEVDNPLFGLMLRMGPVMEEFDEDEEEYY